MNAPMLVVDASVVVKWFASENESYLDRAIELQRRHRDGLIALTAPALLYYEVANALRFNSNLAPGDITQAIQSLFDTDILTIQPEAPALAKAALLALDKKLTVYDSAYLAVADQLHAPLVTADRRFARNIGGAGMVYLLEEIYAQAAGPLFAQF